MPVLVRRKAPRSVKVSIAQVRTSAERMLHALSLDERELSILLTDDPFIRTLNHEHRGKDKPTDVLAFPLHEPEPGGALPEPHAKGARRSTPTGRRRRRPPKPRDPFELLLGDVIISLDTARRQASERGQPLMAEIRFLLAHGLLHLIGYDHQTDAEELAMNEMTRRLVAAARRPDGSRASHAHVGATRRR